MVTPSSTEPLPQFTGVWIPAELFYLFWDGKVNAKQVFALATIAALSKGGEGCWASNAFLAERLNVQPRMLQLMLEELKDIGLIKQTGFDGRYRTLVTCWTEAVAESFKNLQKSKANQEAQEIAPLQAKERRKLRPGGAESCAPAAQKVALREVKGERQRETDAATAALSTSGEASPGLLSNGKTPARFPGDDLVEELFTKVMRLRKASATTSNPAAWKRLLARYLKKCDPAGQTWTLELLAWYIPHMGEPYIPEAFSIDGFIDKRFKISDARDRAAADRNRPRTPAEIEDAEQETLARIAEEEAEREAMYEKEWTIQDGVSDDWRDHL